MYYGSLEDSTEVAVKMRSESSLHGLDEFLAEVPTTDTIKFSTVIIYRFHIWYTHLNINSLIHCEISYTLRFNLLFYPFT